MSILDKEDYADPRCPFCKNEQKESIPVQRITYKLDEKLYAKDFNGAKALLQYWEQEAESLKDERGKLFILNESVGLSRMQNDKESGLIYCEKALSLLYSMNLQDSATFGTTLINVATAYKAFGKTKDALTLYNKAQKNYEKLLKDNDERLASLYNNMALALTDDEQYESAKTTFIKALNVLDKVLDGEKEKAITYCNLASLEEESKKDGYAYAIEEYLNKAYKELISCKNKDEAFVYACEKCIPAFFYYGKDALGNDLKNIIGSINERN